MHRYPSPCDSERNGRITPRNANHAGRANSHALCILPGKPVGTSWDRLWMGCCLSDHCSVYLSSDLPEDCNDPARIFRGDLACIDRLLDYGRHSRDLEKYPPFKFLTLGSL